MRFADPHACPSCGGTIAGQNRCPHCDLVLSSQTSLKLWQTLLEADALLERAKAESVKAPAPKPVFTPAPPVPTPPAAQPPPAVSTVVTPPPMPAAPVNRPAARRWSTGSIILALGALCLVVAAIVFITVSWSVLGPSGRTVVLLFITIAVAAGASMATRARLRASSESLWTVFFALFSIDFFAARSLGLFGLDAVDLDPAMLAFGLVVAIGGAGLALATRAKLPLLVPSLASGLSVWFASFWLTAMVGFNFFWSVFCGLVLVVAAAAAAWKLSLKLIALMSGAAACVYYLAAAGGAIDELTTSPSVSELTLEGHGLPMIVMIAVTVGLGLAYRPFVIPAAVLATGGLALLVFVPAADSSDRAGYIAAAVIAVALAGAAVRGTNDWVRGARIASLGATGALTLSTVGWVANAATAIADSGDEPFTQAWSARLVNDPVLPGPGWLGILVFGAVAGAIFATLRWPEGLPLLRALNPLPATIAAAGIVSGVIAFEPHVLVPALVTLGAGIALLVLHRREHDIWLGVSLAVIVVPACMTLVSERMTLVIWLAIAAVLIAAAVLLKPAWARVAGAGGATALVIGSSVLGADLTTLSELGVRCVVAGVCLASLVLASFLLPRFVGRIGIEAVGGMALLSVLFSAAGLQLGVLALLVTAVGCAVVILGLVVSDRRIYRLAGVGALLAAMLVRLAAVETETVEDYTGILATLIAALVVLAISVWHLARSRHEEDLWLGNGMLLAVIPAGMTFDSQPLTAGTWLVVAAVLIAVAALVEPVWARIAGAVGASGLIIGASALLADLIDVDDLWVCGTVIIVSLLILLVVSFPVRSFVGRQAVEVTTGVGIGLALATALSLDLGQAALIWTASGCVVVVLGLLLADRRVYRIVGVGGLAIAVVIRVGAADTGAVEKYTGTVGTLIAALAMLAIAVWHLARSREEDELWLANGMVLAVLPACMTWFSQPLTVGVWLAVAAVMAGVAALGKPARVRTTAAVVGTGMVIGDSILLADLAGVSDLWKWAAAMVVSLVVLLAISLPLRAFVGRVAVEVTSGIGIIAGLVGASPLDLGPQALLWTIAGAVFAVLGLLVPDRRLFRYVGIVALGVAWVMRLVASDVETVEAYTAPFAVVLLGAGLLAMRDNTQLRTAIALTPGLTLAFLPSLPQALDEPTGPRALLLGLAGLLALGIGAWRRWQMPFVFGAVVVALLVLWNVGPLANGLPRWTLIAAAGVVLISSGITWESRVKNARSAAEFVQNLR